MLFLAGIRGGVWNDVPSLMKTSAPLAVSCFVLTLLISSNLLAAELVKARNGSGVYGYKDTPKLPWCEWLVHDPDRPAPPRMEPGKGDTGKTAPADAIVLFDGSDTSRWSDTDWSVKAGVLIADGERSPQTKDTFGDFQLHLEWMLPKDFDGPWYNQGNNGVMLHGLYEIQIFDSYNEPLYPDGQCAAVYGQTPPMENVTRPPGQWQSYDIFFTAPKFENGELVSPAYVTVLHNGVLVHDHQKVYGAIGHRVLPHYNNQIEKGPIGLAGHGCPVAFRNIWIRPVGDPK
jgi:hypothetical protein